MKSTLNNRPCWRKYWATVLLLSGVLAAQAPPTTDANGKQPDNHAGLAERTSAQAAPPAAVQEDVKPGANSATPPSGAPAAQAHSGDADLQDQDSANHILHVIVGRAVFITTIERMRRVYVSNPTTVDTVTPSPRDLVVTAKAAGTSSVIIWGESGSTTTYTVLADLDVNGLNASLSRALPGSHITAESQQGRVLLSGSVTSVADADQAMKLATIYSKDVVNSLVIARTHPAQVQLKVRFAELDRSKLDQFGINLLALGNNTGASTTGQYNQTAIPKVGGGEGASALISDILNLFYFNVPSGIGFTIKDLQTKGILEILAEPDLITIDGQPAKFLAGGEFPFPVIQPGSGGGTATVTIQFRPYGVKLDFTPFVNPDGTIRLKVAPEVSALDYTNVVVISGYTIPSLSTRHVETEIEVKNGQSFGISGILDRRTTDSFSRMPGIADIPILGQIFRSKSQNHSVMDLIVVVTPTIVDPLNNDVPAVPNPSWLIPPGQINNFNQNLPKNYK